MVYLHVNNMNVVRIIMKISSVEKLKDQGSNGSPAYEFATKIALEKAFRLNILRFRKTVIVPPFRRIVAHTWTISYLLRARGAHYRKAQRIMSKAILEAASDWVGGTVWGSPVVALAPPLYAIKIRNDALIGVSIGAREAMISFQNIYEIKNVIYKIRTNPQAA